MTTELPAVGRFLTDTQRALLTRPAPQLETTAHLAPAIATMIAAENVPMLETADQERYGTDRADQLVDQPAFLLSGWKTWQGRIPLPRPDGSPRCLTVREYEYAETDTTLTILGFPYQLLGDRAVYADTARL